jgi:transcriptional regulator of acetoin/glycerol metabolism
MDNTPRTGYSSGAARNIENTAHINIIGAREPEAGPDRALIGIAAAEIDRAFEHIRGSGYALRLKDHSDRVLYERTDDPRDDAQTLLTACVTAPIHDPSGEPLAALEAYAAGGRVAGAPHAHTIALVRLCAQIIGKNVFLHRYLDHVMLHFHSAPELVDCVHDGVLALAEDGTVIAADAMAAHLLDATDRYELIGRAATDIFAASEEDLSLLELTGTRLWPVRDRRHGSCYCMRVHARDRAAQLDPRRSAAHRASQIVQVMPSAAARTLTLEELAGEDPQMLRNVRSAHRIVDSGVSVLIQGPTGSGKEAFAHAMHVAGQRAQRPFVAVNCAAIPETLIESELFGYKPGAFTGARKEGMRGKILQSSGGTLFLDEIGDMPLALQTRLLRVLEEQQIVPLGSETPIEVDLHVIAASHRNLREMIARGTFREDLYYRLNGITLELPALADRADRDRVIHRVLAAQTSNGRPAAIEMDALQRLVVYNWPGNIRELRNVIRTALAICEGGVIREVDLPRELRTAENATQSAPQDVAPTHPPDEVEPAEMIIRPMNPLKAAERAALLRVIEDCHGNMTRTARKLGMSRNTLYRKMKHHGIPLAHRICSTV